MSLRKAFGGFLIYFLIILLAACSSNSTSESTPTNNAGNTEQAEQTGGATGGELKIAYSAQPPSLDPPASSAIVTAEIMGHVFETLLTTDADYNIQPMLAEAYEQSEDGKTITFHLRKGVLFHNGKEMKAEDVVASMNRWKDGVGGRGQFENAQFEEVDEYTVEINLPEPLSTALLAFAQGGSSFAAIMPKEIVEAAGADGVSEYIGTGPFKFVEWKQDQEIHLTRFEDYQARSEEPSGLAGRREALVDDLRFMIVTDSSTRVAGIQSGEYDFVHEIPIDNVNQLVNNPDLDIHIVPGAGTLAAIPNKKKGIFANAKAREALATALNMEDIMTAAFISPDYYSLNHNLMLPQMKQWYSDIGKDKYNQHDVEKAKQLLAEAGYTGEEVKVITSRDYEYMYNASVVMEQQLEQIGMNVNLEILDWATLLQKMNDEDAHDMFVVWFGFKPEPSSLHIVQKSNSGWTDSPELDRILAEFRSQPNLDNAKPIYDELLEWSWEYIPFIKFGDFSRVDFTRNNVQNLQYQDRPIFWNVSKN